MGVEPWLRMRFGGESGLCCVPVPRPVESSPVEGGPVLGPGERGSGSCGARVLSGWPP